MSERLRSPAVLAGVGLVVVVVVVLVVLLVSGGGSSPRPASHATTATTPSTTAAAAAHKPAAVKKPHRRTRTSASTVHTVATAPPPTPAGTPAAPAGLRQTAGYATYELCAGRCSGAVPSSLRRGLHLPGLGSGGSCPASSSGGPVRPTGVTQLPVMPFIDSSWSGARVSWSAAPSYGGPILIRGRQLGGSGAVGFGEGHVPYDELQLLDSGMGAPAAGGGRAWLSFTRVQGPGCYAYQVDGTSFSSVIVFRAVG